MGGFFIIFSTVPDPRDINARHDLREILFIAFASMLCGAESCVEMAQFGENKLALLRTILELKHGVPSHDTFSRVFRLLDPVALENAFIRFMEAFGRALGPSRGPPVLAVDGKSLKHAYEKGRAHMPPMMVSVGYDAHDARPNPGWRGRRSGSRDRTSSTGVAQWLHCHRRRLPLRPPHGGDGEQRGGDYVIALKLNQRKLYASVAALIDGAGSRAGAAETAEDGHGRHERRSIRVVAAPALAREHGFKGLTTVARVVSERTIDGKTSHEERLFIASRRFAPFDFLDVVRKHWDIENGCHWQQDVVFHEDLTRNRKDNGPRNLALLRRLTANILKANPDKSSTRVKRLKAAWSEDFLLDALTYMQ